MRPLSVIVVGAPRSGTYWVVDLLQTRFGIHIPSETHFVPLYSRYLWLWGDLSKPSNRRRLLQSIYEFLQIWTARSSSSSDYRAQIRRLSLLVTLDEGCAEDIVEESSDYPSLVKALYQSFANIHGADSSGDKSAYYKVMDPELTFGLFPEALMLHVIRDGRDVAMSWTKQWFGPARMQDAARLWRDHVRVNRDWGHSNPERYLEIRYEDIAADREAEIRRMELFLGKPASPAEEGAQSALATALSNTESHAAMLDMNAADNTSKWKSQMRSNDVDCFEEIAGEALVACGYQVSVAGYAKSPIAFPVLSAHLVRVAAKTVLPLVLGICSRLGFSVLPLINRGCPDDWKEVRMGGKVKPGV